MGVYFVAVLWNEPGFYYLGLLAQILQQVPWKIPTNMTQNVHYTGRDSYWVLHTLYVYQHGPLYVYDTGVFRSGSVSDFTQNFPLWFSTRTPPVLADVSRERPEFLLANWQYFNQFTTASSQSLSIYHTLNIVTLNVIRFKILIASLMYLYNILG